MYSHYHLNIKAFINCFAIYSPCNSGLLAFCTQMYIPTINNDEGGYKIEEKADYISLPIKFGYQIGDRFFAFSNIGIATSILLKRRQLSYFPDHYTPPIGGNELTDHYSRISVNAFVELGIGYRINDDIGLYLSGSYQHDLIPLYGKLVTDNIYYQALSFNLGFRLQIGDNNQED